MPALNVSKTYDLGDVLFEADLDTIKDSLETFYNETGIDDDNIQDNSITASSKFIDSTVTTATLADINIGTDRLATDSVTTAKFAASAVTTDKFADNSVTRAKLATANQNASAEFNNSVTGINQTATMGSVTLTTTGRPVLVTLAPDSSGITTVIGRFDLANKSEIEFYVEIYRDSGRIARFPVYFTTSGSLRKHIEIPGSAYWVIDTPAAGSHTYYIKAITGSFVGVAETLTVGYQGKVFAMELQ